MTPDRPFRSAIPPLASLRAFEAYAQTGGIRRAATLLGIDHSAVSRSLKALEVHLQVALVDRARPSGLTPVGERYFSVVSQALGQIENETDSIMHQHRDKLTLWCIPGLAFQWLLPRLRGFSDARPEVELELRPSDVPPDPHNAGVDGDVRYVRDGSAGNLPFHQTIELARPTVFPVCSPAYLAGLAPIQKATDLLQARLLHEDSDAEWRSWLLAQGVSLPDEALQGPRLWHAHLVLDECRNGRGIALANSFLLGDDLAHGRMVRLDGLSGPFLPVALGAYVLSMRTERWSERPVARFRQWLAQTMADA